MEIWDAYLEDGSLAGCDLIRGSKIPQGLFHLVCEIIVRHIDGSYLLMQRDYNKPNYPGLYEASAGGSATKGESKLEAAKRELEEETGIKSDKLVEIYCYKSKDTIYIGYLCETDWNKNDITLQEGETISFLWLGKEDFLEFVNSEKYVDTHRNRIDEFIRSIK